MWEDKQQSLAFPFVKMKKLAWCGSRWAPHSEIIHVGKITVITR